MRKRTLSEAKQELADTIEKGFDNTHWQTFTVPWPQPNTYRLSWGDRRKRWKRWWSRRRWC